MGRYGFRSGICGLWLALLPVVSAQISLVGAGIQFSPQVRNGFPVVQRALRDSPAAAAGLRPDEVVWSVDGVSTQGKTVAEVTAMIAGELGTPRTLVVGAEQRSVTLTLARIRGKLTAGNGEEGEGRLEEPDGSVYVGAFVRGRFEGWGSYVTADGNRYEAHFHDGLPDGEGKYFDYKRGFVYRGAFRAGRFDGVAVIEMMKGGASYTGPFAHHQPSGEGVLTFANGAKRTLAPASFAALLAAAAVPPPAPSVPPALQAAGTPARRTLGIDDRANDPDPLAAFVDQLKTVERKISDTLDAYPAFRVAFKAALNRRAGNSAAAAKEALPELERLARPWAEAGTLLQSLRKSVAADTTFNQRQLAAFQGWASALTPIFDEMHRGRVDGKYTPGALYWMDMNVEVMRQHLAAAQRQRRNL